MIAGRVLSIDTQYARGAEGPAGDDSLVVELRAVLIRLARQMTAEGAAPQHLREMIWQVADPAALVRERRAIDLVYRDVFGGMRPPIKICPNASLKARHCQIGISAEIAIPSAADSPPRAAYRELDLAVLGREYSARAAVPDHLDVFARWREEGEAYRQHQQTWADLPYGLSEAERFDFFHSRGGRKRPPLVVLLHGGYWQAMDKSDHCQLVADLVATGAAAAVINYGLAPEVRLAEIVAQVRRCLAHLRDGAGYYGFDPARIYLVGHSAGAHLAAMLLVQGWDDDLAGAMGGALLVSGLFDLEPLSLLPVGRVVGIEDREEARRLSPTLHEPVRGTRIIVAVGGAETAEFKRQSGLLAEAWAGCACIDFITVDGANHFSVIEGLRGGVLGAAAASMIHRRQEL